MSDPNKVPTPEEGNEPKEPETPETPEGGEGAQPETVTLSKEDYDKLQREKEEADKKFSESSREAQILMQKNKQYEDRINSLTSHNVNDEELREAYPDWDLLNDETKRAYRDIYSTKKATAATNKLVMDMYEERKWNEDFAKTVESHPDLKGREAEFKQYAYKPTHKGVNLEVLAKSFLFDVKPPAPAKETPKGAALEPGSAGQNSTPPKQKLSAEDIAAIRTNNPSLYREMLASGKIRPEDLID